MKIEALIALKSAIVRKASEAGIDVSGLEIRMAVLDQTWGTLEGVSFQIGTRYDPSNELSKRCAEFGERWLIANEPKLGYKWCYGMQRSGFSIHKAGTLDQYGRVSGPEYYSVAIAYYDRIYVAYACNLITGDNVWAVSTNPTSAFTRLRESSLTHKNFSEPVCVMYEHGLSIAEIKALGHVPDYEGL